MVHTATTLTNLPQYAQCTTVSTAQNTAD
jgi:hypothetical protein